MREDMEEDIRALARSLRIEAEFNTRVMQQQYERRQQRYGASARPKRHSGRERSTSDNNSLPGDRFFTAQEPGQFDPQDMGNPSFPRRRGRSGNRRKPPQAFQNRFDPVPEEPGLDENGQGNVEYDARDPAGQHPDLDRHGPMPPPPQQGGLRHSPGRQ
ncbi:MAG: hypothetical protein Q9221_000178 [Calogaya cf. arnoldii]